MKKEKISLKELIERNKEELLKDSEAVEKIETSNRKKDTRKALIPHKSTYYLI